MKTFFITMILTLLKRLSSPALVDEVKRLVVQLMSMDIPGAEKKELLLDMLQQTYQSFARELANMAPSLLNLIIEAAVVWAKNQQKPLQ